MINSAIPIMNQGDGFRKGLNLSSHRDLPGGQITDFPVQPHLQKYFASRVGQITSRTPAVQSHRGALRNVINAERDAVDAGTAGDEQRRPRTVKSCGPDASTPASSLARRSAR